MSNSGPRKKAPRSIARRKVLRDNLSVRLLGAPKEGVSRRAATIKARKAKKKTKKKAKKAGKKKAPRSLGSWRTPS